ncbi:MAG TPA: hypothetical protein VFW73_07150 [Lacipirellulaceae bacterium]|nr:hypothetical protein [Lacipirellulaceae bacterium]
MAGSTQSSEARHARPNPPPLRIHHLLACAIVASALFVWWRNAIPADYRTRMPAIAVAFSAIGEVLVAVEFTFAVFSVYWHLRGYAGLVQPGQWLMARRIVFVVQVAVARFIVSPLRVAGPWSKSLWNFSDIFLAAQSVLYTILLFVVAALSVLFFLWCAVRVADSRPWRVLFLLAAVRSLIDLLPLTRIFLPTSWPLDRVIALKMIVTSTVMLSVLGWIAWNERRLRRKRFWTHWLGMGFYAVGDILELSGGIIDLLWY